MSFYYLEGNEVAKSDRGETPSVLEEKADYKEFQKAMTPADALYFAVGTFTTAGTGNVDASSDEARDTATIQMFLGIFVLVIGVGGVLNGLGRSDRGFRA